MMTIGIIISINKILWTSAISCHYPIGLGAREPESDAAIAVAEEVGGRKIRSQHQQALPDEFLTTKTLRARLRNHLWSRAESGQAPDLDQTLKLKTARQKISTGNYLNITNKSDKANILCLDENKPKIKIFI
jgi:hypothetical protein